MDRVSSLIADIETNEDLKASVDYNTRMLGEVAVLLNESIRLQAATANTLGADSVATARDAFAARTFRQTSE